MRAPRPKSPPPVSLAYVGARNLLASPRPGGAGAGTGFAVVVPAIGLALVRTSVSEAGIREPALATAAPATYGCSMRVRRTSHEVWTRSTPGLVWSAVHVASMIDVNNVDAQQSIVDAVDDPVASSPSGAQASQLAAEPCAEPVWIIGQRAEDEV